MKYKNEFGVGILNEGYRVPVKKVELFQDTPGGFRVNEFKIPVEFTFDMFGSSLLLHLEDGDIILCLDKIMEDVKEAVLYETSIH